MKKFKFLLIFLLAINFICANDSDESKKETKKGHLAIAHAKPSHYSPKHVHNVKALSSDGDSLVLEDDSVWKVYPSDYKKILKWDQTDALIISQNTAWHNYYSGYQYKIINTTTNSYVRVQLHLGPKVSNPQARKIKKITGRDITLDNNLRFKVDLLDSMYVYKWIEGDGIVIGVNQGSFSLKPYILINVNLDTYVSAKEK